MAWVCVRNVEVTCPNPTRLDGDISLSVSFDCLKDLQHPLQWRLIYVGSADDQSKDQELECCEIGPLKRGSLRFSLEADPPDFSQIDPQDVWGSTVLLLEASYKGQEFLRIGWYVYNVYVDPALQEDPPDEPDMKKMVRYIMANEPRVTRFQINWTDGVAKPPEAERNAVLLSTTMQ